MATKAQILIPITAAAFIVGEDFIGNNKVSLILGDNLFYGNDLSSTLQRVKNQQEGATIFCNKVTFYRNFKLFNLRTLG